MALFIVSMERSQRRSSDVTTLRHQVKYVAERGVSGSRSKWDCIEIDEFESSTDKDGELVYKTKLTFERKRGRSSANPERLSHEMQEIIDHMTRAANAHKWVVKEPTHDWPSSKPKKVDSSFIDFERALTFDEITIPPVLINGSDDEIEEHPAFNTIYGRSAHIRIMAAAMNTMILTKGKRRNHHVLYGLPSCGKSSLFHSWQQVIGKGGFISINANSATRAGIETLFVIRLEKIGIPPFIFVEEIEKTLEQTLTVWLSVMDDRAEIRKIVHGKMLYAIVRSLVFATVNDKLQFDKMMGGRPGHPGALSSRMTGMYVPRPDLNVMRRILMRDISLYYPEAGKDADIWAYKCIEIAKEIGTTDPRIVTGFLDGRNRLLEDDYKDDIIRLHQLEREDRERQKNLNSGVYWDEDDGY